MKTIGVELRHGYAREVATNNATIAVLVRRPREHDFAEVFHAAYDDFAGALRAIDEPALAVVAIDEARGKVAGILRLSARPGRLTGGVLGRHGCCDLYVDGDESMSLRQLAVLAGPARSWRRGVADLGYRLVDLRTGTGFSDENGRQLLAVRCEGTAFFRCGELALLMLVAGDPSDWPRRAADAWSMIPERVFFDERAAGAAVRLVAPAPFDGRRTLVTAVRPPRLMHEPAGGGEPVGTLQIAGTSIEIGEEALREGVLVGRYPRCTGAELVDEQGVSRTHLLVIALDGRVCALDTGSTNGTWRDGARVRLVELRDGSQLRLGYDTTVTWRARG